MQDDQTVSFQPMYVDGAQPWYTQVFALYILIVLVVFIVRAIKIIVNLRKLRIARKRPVPATVVSSLWAHCCAKAHSFKELSVLTFFASLLNVTWSTANVFFSARAEKITNINFVLTETADGLVSLALGLIICIALYASAMLFQAMLRRQNPSDLLPVRDGNEANSVPSI